MSSWIDSAAELHRLEEWLSSLFERDLPSGHFRVAEETRRRLGLRGAGNAGWTHQFSDLVALYPLYQAEALGENARELARRATESHLLLLIYAFLDDRLLDGETAPRRDVLLFHRYLYHRARQHLLLHFDPEIVGDAYEGAERAYLRSQGKRYRDCTSYGEVCEIVAERAGYGLIASLVILAAAGLGTERLVVAKRAFDALAIGMQWQDDLEDRWQDRALGSENLLDSVQPNGVADAELLEHAKDEGRSWWRLSASLLRELGAEAAAEVVDSRAVTSRSPGGPERTQ